MPSLFFSWLESVSLLMPKTFKRFVLITLSYTGYLFRQAVSYWWFWIPLIFACFLAPPRFFLTVLFISTILWTFFVFATLRTSVDLKNLRYYGYLLFSYVNYYAIAALLTFLSALLLYGRGPYLLVLFISIHLSILFVFFTLFMLDSYGSLPEIGKSGLRAAKMIVYNYPICFALAVTAQIVIAALQFIIPNRLLLFCGLLLLFPLFVCFLANVYIKRLHEQFSLYYRS